MNSDNIPAPSAPFFDGSDYYSGEESEDEGVMVPKIESKNFPARGHSSDTSQTLPKMERKTPESTLMKLSGPIGKGKVKDDSSKTSSPIKKLKEKILPKT